MPSDSCIYWVSALVLWSEWVHKTDILKVTVQCPVGETDNCIYIDL